MGTKNSKICPKLSSEEIENPIYLNSQKKSTNLNKLPELLFNININKLPELLLINIYKDYLEAEIYYKIYKNIIESEEGRCLNNKNLAPLIPIILSKPHVCKYISKNCKAFFESFKSHKINNKKAFTLMNKGDSFSLFILFYIYH